MDRAASQPSMLREARVEIDLSRLGANLARLRAEVGAQCRILAVIKGDGYGAGMLRSGQALEAAGVDALAVGNADDAATLRNSGVKVDILVYGSTPPDRAAELVALDAILTIHDVASMKAIVDAAQRRTIATRVMVKIDCGLARLGVAEADWSIVFSTLNKTSNIQVEGIFTHLAGQQDAARVTRQSDAFVRGCEAAAREGVAPALRMLASSRVILDHPDLNLTAIDPGRLLFGLARDDWESGYDYEPVIARFVARIVQVSTLTSGSIPYGSDTPIDSDLRVAVVAAGTADGLVFTQPGQRVLVGGRSAVQLGPPGIEHSMVDITGLPDVKVGDDIVYFGRSGDETITPLEFARFCGRPVDQVMPLIGRLARRGYRED